MNAAAALGIFIWGGAKAQGVSGTEVRQYGPGRSPGRGLGARSPPEAEAVCGHCFQILTAESIEILKNYAQFTSWFLTSIIHGGELSDILGV